MKLSNIFMGLAALVLCAAPVFANEMMSADEKVQKMTSELNLSPDQVNKVRPIIEDYSEKMRKASQEKESKLNKILSQDQINQLQSMKKDKYKE